MKIRSYVVVVIGIIAFVVIDKLTEVKNRLMEKVNGNLPCR